MTTSTRTAADLADLVAYLDDAAARLDLDEAIAAADAPAAPLDIAAARAEYARIRAASGAGAAYFDRQCRENLDRTAIGGADRATPGAWVAAARQVAAEIEAEAADIHASIGRTVAELRADAEGRGDERCGPCGGCGRFVLRVENGRPVTRGTCYRCGGKGYQTADDRARNFVYDMRRSV